MSSPLNDLTRNHRAARAELHEGMAALTNCAAKGALKPDGTRMSKPPKVTATHWTLNPHTGEIRGVPLESKPEPMKIVIERSPYPNCEPQYRWTAYRDGYEDELSKSAMTPDKALELFLIASSNRDEPEID